MERIVRVQEHEQREELARQREEERDSEEEEQWIFFVLYFSRLKIYIVFYRFMFSFSKCTQHQRSLILYFPLSYTSKRPIFFPGLAAIYKSLLIFIKESPLIIQKPTVDIHLTNRSPESCQKPTLDIHLTNRSLESCQKLTLNTCVRQLLTFVFFFLFPGSRS